MTGTKEELRNRISRIDRGIHTEYLHDEEKEKVVDGIMDGAPEVLVVSIEQDNQITLIGIASGDILAVIPVLFTSLILGFRKIPLMLSWLIASIAIEYIDFLYAGPTGRRKCLAAGVFFT